ncbi:MAG: hypothetical protein AAF636_22580 [Pseudomonadota bacterium]
MNASSIKRRSLLKIPVLGAGLALTAPATAAGQTDALNSLVDELEEAQGWEPYNVAMARAYAAYRLRQALGMPLPDPKCAQAHIDMQRGQYQSYQRSYLHELDVKNGEVSPPPCETLTPFWE